MEDAGRRVEGDIDVKAVGRRVRAVRLERGLTSERLAEAADTSSQFLSKIEKGEQQMTIGKFAKLAGALGVSADYLLFGRDERLGRAALAAEYLGAMNPIERDLLSRAVIALQGTLQAMRPEE